jgi:carbonic anhydrase/acetyltransferase-like protein (isoleucine patch superfamily)
VIQRLRDKVPQIHPTAWVHPMATVIGDVVLGPHVSVWPSAVLRGDCGPIRIGAFTNIQDGAVVHTTQDLSEAIVGERVTVGHCAILHGCRIDDDCLIGMNATVLDNAHISTQSIVAAGSVVTVGKKFPPRVMLIGSPARVARDVEDKHLVQIDYGWRAYQGYMQPFVNGEVETIG